MRLFSPVRGATGVKVLIIFYLALAGRQARGEEQTQQPAEEPARQSVGESANAGQEGKARQQEKENARNVPSEAMKKAKEIFNNYKRLRKGEPWEYLKVDDELSPFFKQSSAALSDYLAVIRGDGADSLDSYLKNLQEDIKLTTGTQISTDAEEGTQRPSKKPSNQNFGSGNYKTKSELISALPDAIREAVIKTDAAEHEYLQQWGAASKENWEAPIPYLRKYFAIRLEEREKMRKALADAGDKAEELFDLYNQVRDGQPSEETKRKFASLLNDKTKDVVTYLSFKGAEAKTLDELVIDPGTKELKKTKKRFGSKKRNSNLRGNRELESEFRDMKKRRSRLEEKLEKRSNLQKRQEKDAKIRGRKVFDLEENMEDEDFMERFVEDRQDMENVDRIERSIDKGSGETNHRKANPDKGDSSSSGGSTRGGFWFSIVVGIIAEAVVIIVVLFAYRNDIFRRREMSRSTREAEPLNPYRRYSSKISSATTFSHSMIH